MVLAEYPILVLVTPSLRNLIIPPIIRKIIICQKILFKVSKFDVYTAFCQTKILDLSL